MQRLREPVQTLLRDRLSIDIMHVCRARDEMSMMEEPIVASRCWASLGDAFCVLLTLLLKDKVHVSIIES